MLDIIIDIGILAVIATGFGFLIYDMIWGEKFINLGAEREAHEKTCKHCRD